MDFANGLTLILWGLALSLTAFGAFLTHKRSKSGPPHLDAAFSLYPVSILKPLKGVDSGLRKNLESFFKLDYPEYELLFSVADADDRAVPIVRGLIRDYPGVSARLLIGQVEIGVNPKINNLVRSYELARHDWILISDSNVRAEPSYLKRLVAHLECGVGMVTSVVAGRDPQRLGGILEAIYLNTFYVRGMNVAAAFGKPCVIGKSMLFSRTTARRFGGVRNLAQYLAEDFMAGEAMRRLGLRVVIASDPVEQVIGDYSLESFWSRHLRWGRIRKAQAPFAFLLEPFFGGISSGLIGAWGFHHCFGVPISSFLIGHLLFWLACELVTLRAIGAKLVLHQPIAWLLRELLAIPLWLHIASGNSVIWRGRRFSVKSGGLLEPLPNAKSL